jgi:predicted nucleotidyltransferase
MQATSIGDALFTKTQQRVLGLLYGTPDKSFYTNEIMRWADMGRGTISRELDRLVSAGILSVTPKGNQNHYQAKQDNPVYTELLGIVRKTFGVADVIRQALKRLNAQIKLAFIYGSIAKGTDARTSDIDLMLIGEGLNYGDVMDVLMPFEESLQRSVNPTIFTSAEFASRLDQNSSFLVRVMEQPKLVIIGVIDDFREPRTLDSSMLSHLTDVNLKG